IMHSYHATEFAAVALPKDTAEVQAIVKLCNKHKLPFRPVCTGFRRYVSRCVHGSVCGPHIRASRISEEIEDWNYDA
ncbi:MAG: FAD-binding protein, partial [Candidatus Acidiferrales bacterium]